MGGIWLVDKVLSSPAPPRQKVELHQDEAQDQPEAANERFLPALKSHTQGTTVPTKPVVKRPGGGLSPPAKEARRSYCAKGFWKDLRLPRCREPHRLPSCG